MKATTPVCVLEEVKTGRAEIVEEASRRAAAAWAETKLKALASEGRPIRGGWPGTLAEARGQAAAWVGAALRLQTLPSLTYEELTSASRLTYAEARRAWLRHVEPE